MALASLAIFCAPATSPGQVYLETTRPAPQASQACASALPLLPTVLSPNSDHTGSPFISKMLGPKGGQDLVLPVARKALALSSNTQLTQFLNFMDPKCLSILSALDKVGMS